VLADVDLLSRALLASGDLSPVADAWWVGDPWGGAGDRVAALGLGAVSTRSGTAEELTAGPLRVLYPVTLVALVPVALLLVLAGTALAVTGDVRARALELARLRALGLRRRDVRRGLLAQHGALLVVLVTLGASVGWACTRLLAPLLIRSDTGGEPVPGVRTLWPWASEGPLLAAYALGCVGVAAVVVLRRARRADTAHLRLGA
jgi:predicted lysophospholipase L1 biosynthesis ABC-type transport system permease subunit